MVRPTLAAAVGNQAIQTLLHGGWLRAKLELGEGAVGTPIGAPGRISEPGSGFPPTARETFWQLGLSGALRF